MARIFLLPFKIYFSYIHWDGIHIININNLFLTPTFPSLIAKLWWVFVPGLELTVVTPAVQDLASASGRGYQVVCYDQPSLWDHSVLAENFVDTGSASMNVYVAPHLMSGAPAEGLESRRAPHAPCPLCGTEVSRANLQRHIRTHTGLKLYSCQECAYKTGDKSNFKRHLHKIHPNSAAEQFRMYEQDRKKCSEFRDDALSSDHR